MCTAIVGFTLSAYEFCTHLYSNNDTQRNSGLSQQISETYYAPHVARYCTECMSVFADYTALCTGTRPVPVVPVCSVKPKWCIGHQSGVGVPSHGVVLCNRRLWLLQDMHAISRLATTPRLTENRQTERKRWKRKTQMHAAPIKRARFIDKQF